MKFEIFSILALLVLQSRQGETQICGGNHISCLLFSLLSPLFQGETSYLNYLLFTRSNPEEACDLQPTEEAVRRCRFNPDLKTEVIIHGYIDKFPPYNLFFDIKDKLLQVEDSNVVVFNWTSLSNTFNLTSEKLMDYRIAAMNSIFVGLRMSAWIHFLQVNAAANAKKFHLIGHSLGAEVASIAGKTLCNLGHITDLDAAGVTFRDLPSFLMPEYTDALYVEAIHTDAIDKGFGFIRPIGYIDYYVNDGVNQLKCYMGAMYMDTQGDINTVNSASTKRSCRHDSAVTYYLYSINKNCKFMGRICDSYEDFASGKCSAEKAPVCRMGYYSNRIPGLPIHSKCFLDTSAKPPFCLN